MISHCEPSEDTVERCLERVRLAWNSGDAHAFAAEFTMDATYVIFFGVALLERDEIEKNHVDVLTRWQKGSRMIIQVINKRRLCEGAISVLTIGGIGKGTRLRYDKIQTFTMICRDKRWMCSAFQNTEMNGHAKRAYNGRNDRTLFDRLSSRMRDES